MPSRSLGTDECDDGCADERDESSDAGCDAKVMIDGKEMVKPTLPKRAALVTG
ncbi:hypothetical protein KJI95_18880 [Shewanella sp. JM162201]|uniref:Uncharacterized protein n=1 Tax=Shewanella jiangmenensis TaxID=2837387 RepID=A0ABS5V7Z4_9GAMM|nr:hypothetical protein [Shewanella jiangmenensis]MBT1446564.1 hypothetical protein [Shewanella jiangmenensis]